MKVKDVMNKQVITVTPSNSVYDVWKIIFKKHIHGVPVVDAKKNLIGSISEEDILSHIYPAYDEFIVDLSTHNFTEIENRAKDLSKAKIKDIVNKNAHHAVEDDALMRILSKMMIYNVRQLPVTDKNKKVVGMISRGDIFDALFTKYLKNAT